MADENGGKKKLLIIGGLVVGIAIILALAVGGTLFFLDKDSGEPESEAVTQEEEGGIELNTAAYYSFEQAFVTPLISSDRKQRFMQLSLSIKGADHEVVAAVEMHMPRIKNDLNRLFTEQDYQTLQTPEGKRQLQASAAEVVQAVVGREGAQIDEVLITDFVLQ
ncbi:flagellar basal body-associated FliL family protein [Marinospirillum perlucidum]|uniref:flagellar basal body-associated FliL family protein n=1 Tax=Marinospirillum perlucidum TaxID=1982602 RepID=UPI000DF132D0|nr:flagellar basal body-associated FliL family protein [Marinospirillum perlucidum]